MILFRFSPVKFAQKIFQLGSSLGELKEGFKREERPIKKTTKRSVKTEKIDHKKKEVEDMHI